MSSPSDTAQREALGKEVGVTPAPEMPSDPHDVVRNEKTASIDDGPEASDSPDAKEFKEGGYGWVVVIAVAFVNAHTWGLNSAYAVFLAYYLHSNAFPGATPIDFAFVGGLSVSISFLVSPLVTICIHLYGTRATMMIGVVFEAVAFVGASFTTKVWHLALSQGVAFGIGMGFLFSASIGIPPQWFHKKRSLASAIATSGTGFGGVCYSLATNAMIKNIGLAWAFRVLAIIAFVVNGVCALVVRDRNKAVGAVHVALHKDLFKRVEFYLLLAWGCLSTVSYIIVVFSLPDYAQQMGMTAKQGSIVAACFNVSQAVGRPVIGLVSDKVGRINIAALGTAVAGVATLVIWTLAGKHYPGVIVYSLFGFTAGLIWPTVGPITAEVVGLQILPSALSITWLCMVIPSTFAEVIGLALKNSGTNGYLDVQMFSGTLFLVAFACAWALRVWKLHDMEALGLIPGQEEGGARSLGAGGLGRAQSEGAARRKTKYTMASVMKAAFAVRRV